MDAKDFYPLCTVGKEYDSDERVDMQVIDLGTITISSGTVMACDPFMFLDGGEEYAFPNGTFPVKITEVGLDAAYLSVIVRDEPAVSYEVARPVGVPDDAPWPEDGPWGATVDCTKAGLVDGEAARAFYQQESAHDIVWPEDEAGGWIDIIDDENHYRVGEANIPIPGDPNGASIAICHSGNSLTTYPLVYAYNTAGELVACHLDFMVVGNEQYET